MEKTEPLAAILENGRYSR